MSATAQRSLYMGRSEATAQFLKFEMTRPIYSMEHS